MFEYTLFLCVFLIGKTLVPKGINEVKLISSGKILENNKTVAQCKTPFREVAGGGVTLMLMHVVVQPSLSKTKTGTNTFSFFVYVTLLHIRKMYPFLCVILSCLWLLLFLLSGSSLLLVMSSASSYIHKADN